MSPPWRTPWRPAAQRLLAGRELDDPAEACFCTRPARHEKSGLYLVLRRPQVFTAETIRLLHTVSLGCAVVCVALSVCMGLALSRQMFRPIQRLRQGIGEVEHDNLDVRVPAGREDELGELSRRFNNMVEALRRNREALVENQRELNQAQIRMLQAQLNPHFLCNTLDTMKWISKINRVPQVAEMSANLADILRFASRRRSLSLCGGRWRFWSGMWRSRRSGCPGPSPSGCHCRRSWRSAGFPR